METTVQCQGHPGTKAILSPTKAGGGWVCEGGRLVKLLPTPPPSLPHKALSGKIIATFLELTQLT